MIILNEHLTFDRAGIVVEAAEGSKKLIMRGIFVQGDTKNLNERIYPVDEIRKAVTKINDQISEGFPVCGELDHPTELQINLQQISHILTKMWMEGPNGMGQLEIIPTPCGQIARTLIESGVRLGVSSRGSGNVDHRGYVSDFDIVTVDLVCNPSAPNAYPKAVYEAFNGKRGLVIEDLAKAVYHDPKAQKYLHSELITWIDTLR